MTKDDYVLICKRCGDDLGIEYVPDEQPEPYAYAYVREDGVGQLGWVKKDKSLFLGSLEEWIEVPLYTHPHQWQGLTDDEKLASIRKWAENNTMRGQELIGLCDAIEQALRGKNAL